MISSRQSLQEKEDQFLLVDTNIVLLCFGSYTPFFLTSELNYHKSRRFTGIRMRKDVKNY